MWGAAACLLLLLGQRYLFASPLYEYHFVEEEMPWEEARNHCRTHYSDLATVTSMADAGRLQEKTGNWVWIGLHIPQTDHRVWHWSLPGLDFNESRTHWNLPEPNDVGGSENCGFIRSNLTWGDVSCNEKGSYICYDGRENSSQKFHLRENYLKWVEAQKICRQDFTDLVSGLDQLRDEDLRNTVKAYNNWMFIGLFRDTWKWSDGSHFSFRNWDKTGDKGKMCAAMKGKGWKPADCKTMKSALCYDDKVELVREDKTWEEALKHCRQHHHDLVSITSLDEQRWIREKAKMADSTRVWLGLRHSCALDLWFWVSNQLVYYHNWGAEVRVENCNMSGAMERGGGNKWVSMQDTEKLNFLCLKH